jgi:PKD repeat protein
VEDYTVVARPNTMPPTVNFTSNYVPGGCVNPVRFTDQSSNGPTSWLWDFGDGTTSTAQNPTHQYAATGSYTVSLSATNANGTGSASQPNAVAITVPCLSYCASNGTGPLGPNGTLQASPFYTTSVSVTNAQPAFSNATGNATGGYAYYSTPVISVNAGGQVNLTVVTNAAVVHRTSVWIDYNLNGFFESSELVADNITPATSTTFNGTFRVPITASGRETRMRVLSVVNTNFPSPCSVNLLNAEVEDYQLRVLPLATREGAALPALALFPNPTLDGRLRLQLPEANAAGLYATEVQNLLGATVLRTALRLGPAADAELDLRSLAPGVYVLRLRNPHGQTALRRVVRE